jgi:pyridoxal 5'-phosphate synthase pdxS subunit
VTEYGTLRVKTGLAEMLKGGVIMDVVDAEQARVAEEAGACAVMALERVPADIRKEGGVARMADPQKIKDIQEAVSIPVMAKCRIGHFAEARILEALEVDYIDESEVLTPVPQPAHVPPLPVARRRAAAGWRDRARARRRPRGVGAAHGALSRLPHDR